MDRRRKLWGYFLLGAYAAALLWLLFGRARRGVAEVPYLHQLPLHMNLHPFRTIRLYLKLLQSGGPNLVRIALANLLGNVVLFLPMGFLLPLLLPGLRRWYRVLLTAAGIIAAVELLQMVLLVGTCDVDDLLLNLLGAAAGYGLFAYGNSAGKKQAADS